LVVGIDLGGKKHEICIIDWEGKKTLKASIENTREALDKFSGQFKDPSRIRVAMECGSSSPWISAYLEKRGFNVYVGNVRKMRAIWDTDNKTDARDAEMIARIARFDVGLLHPIRHRGKEAQSDLAVLKARDSIVRNRTVLINSVRGLCRSAGTSLPSCSADSFASKCNALIPEDLRTALLPLLAMIDSQTKLIHSYDSAVEKLCEKYPETENMRQIDGVGALTALGFVLTLESPARFAKSRDVGPFLGLTPRRDQSGDSDKPLGITKAGNGYMRRLLVGAACYIMGPFGPPCDLRRAGRKISGNGDSKVKKRKAKVAVARKLAVLMHRLWMTGEEYDPNYKRNIKQRKAA